MSNVEETIDFKALENELLNAIEDDKRYWRENDAKLRAVNQRVATYEEFRDIVKAAHLKPLEKMETLSSGPQQKQCVWNSLAAKRMKDTTDSHNLRVGYEINEQKLSIHNTADVKVTNPTVFCCTYVSLKTREEKYQLLIKTGAERLGELFRLEIPISLFSQLLEGLRVFPSTVKDIISVTQILEVFTHTKRFNLNLDFLNREDKENLKSLMDKLSESLNEREQDLAEQGVTEWSVAKLRQTYKV